MPYGEKSAYEAQAKLKGQSPAYKKSSGFKMNGNPFQKNFKIKPEKEGEGKYHYKKAKKKKPGDTAYVHKYIKEGSVNVDYPGHGPGAGRLKHGYPKWVKE